MAEGWDFDEALDDVRARVNLFQARRRLRRAIGGCSWLPGLALGEIADAVEAIVLAKLSGPSTERDYLLWQKAGEHLCNAMHLLPVNEANQEEIRTALINRESPEA